MSLILDNKIIQKKYKEYLIELKYDLDSINILIQQNNSIYQGNFNLEYLHSFKLLISSFTIQEIIEFIIGLIDMNKIEIKKENNILKLILISNLPNHSNVELNLNKRNIISNEMIEKLFEEINNLKEENKELKNYINKLNKKIEEKDKELEKRIEILEGFHTMKDKRKIQLKSCNLKNINSIHSHKNWINSLSTFPSGNIISVSSDKSIIIYDINLNILQNIQNAHDDGIIYVEIKDILPINNFINFLSFTIFI